MEELDVAVSVLPIGTQEVTIDLATNSPLTPVVKLVVISESDVPPPYVHKSGGALSYRGSVNLGDRRTTFVRTWEEADTSPWLSRVEADLDCVSVNLREIEAAGEGIKSGGKGTYYVPRTYVLDVTLSKSPEGAIRRGNLRAFAGGQTDPVATVPILIEPGSAVQAYPNVLNVTAPFPREYKLAIRAPVSASDFECALEEGLPGWITVTPTGKLAENICSFQML